jgi:hypothetical protein
MAFSASAIDNSFAGAGQGKPTSIREAVDRGVALGPRFQCPLLPFQIAGDVAVVQRFDVEALDVAGAMAQLVGFEQALSPSADSPMCCSRTRLRVAIANSGSIATARWKSGSVCPAVTVRFRCCRPSALQATASSLPRAASSVSRWWRAILQLAFGNASQSD